MRKNTFIMVASLLFAIMLSACTGGTNLLGTATPGAFGNGTSEPGLGAGTTATQSTGNGAGLSTTPTQPSVSKTPAPTSPTTPNAMPTVKATTAATPTTSGSTTDSTPSTSAQTTGARISLLLGAEVKTQDGQKVGLVSDVILNLGLRDVQYFVVALTGATGTTGANTKDIAVPCSLVTIDTQPTTTGNSASSTTPSNNFIVIKFNKIALDNAPEFMPASLPALGQPVTGWDKTLVDYWGQYGFTSNNGTTGSTANPNQGLNQLQGVILATKVMGFSINADIGNIIGQVNDIVINPANCQISYVMISYGATGSNGSFIIPVPPSSFSLGPDGTTFVIPGADRLLNGAPHFNLDQLPDMSITGWDKEIQSFWQSLNNTTNP